MAEIIYHVATTVDNFIARPDGSVNGFLEEGDHISDFIKSWSQYDTVLMGGKTYEFGYQFGLQPGQPAYPNMMHYVFSKTLQFQETGHVKIVRGNTIDFIRELKERKKKIWLCGGSQFAGFLLDNELIDELILKINPVIFGEGLPLFGSSKKCVDLKFTSVKSYNSGVILSSYTISYK